MTQPCGSPSQSAHIEILWETKSTHSLHVQTIGLASEVPVLLPVRQLGPDRVAALLVDDLGDELWGRHVDHVKGAEPGAPDRPVNVSLDALSGHHYVHKCIFLLNIMATHIHHLNIYIYML